MVNSSNGNSAGKKSSTSSVKLGGTTLRVYRLMYRAGQPLGVNEVQRLAKLSSPSVAFYHLSKLKELGMVRESAEGYIVDRIMFENMIRIRKSIIPLQTTFAIFFGTTLIALILLFRPTQITSLYAFALIVNSAAFAIFTFEAIQTLRNTSTE